LVFSRLLGHPIDRPAAVWQRYQGQRPEAKVAFWLQQAPISTISAGMRLYIGLRQPSLVRWSRDNWLTLRNLPTWDSGIGLHIAEIDASAMRSGDDIEFTYRHAADGDWLGRNYQITLS